ncbi:putative MFS family arabinose efflux permease [Flavimobilis soli]|uniref:Putative MFS family arabinose efflux permease n=1 Tax=Flavimobilis soli TaxID=442709 RepID=A0A2A9EG64_9MICO|nr:MFS transporter [Flavimobilis soli]PFG37242.1 putative MFS family arabinose efflux permease [Flavimobilis soli]
MSIVTPARPDATAAGTEHVPTLIAATGLGYYPLAFVARLPFAMVVVGVLTYVVAMTGSVALGGLAAGAVGVGVVIAGPVVGATVDRRGQRTVLPAVALANVVAVLALAFAVGQGVPSWAVVACSFLAGATVPQVAPLSRTRLVTLVGERLAPNRRVKAFARVMSYESAVDETAFVVGPVLVGLLAAWIAPWLPLVTAAALSLTAVVAFALHPTGAVRAHAAHDAERAPLREVVRARVLVVVAGAFAVGLFFGATLTSLTAHMGAQGRADDAGLLYGAMGLTSATLALGAAALPRAFVARWRWVGFAVVIAASAAFYAQLGVSARPTVALLLMGMGVGPVLVTLLSMASDRSPVGRAATTMTLATAALSLAQALASALTGQVAERVGAPAAMWLPLAAAGLLLVLGGVNVLVERRAGR